MPPQEPRKTIQTTGLLLLPPPSPPKSVTQALQEPSEVVGADASISIQPASTPSAIEKKRKKKRKNRKRHRTRRNMQFKHWLNYPKQVLLPNLFSTRALTCWPYKLGHQARALLG